MLKGIIIYTTIMSAGIYLGKKSFLKSILKNSIDKLFTILLVLMLFIMGISFGSNKNIIDSLGGIGYKAFVMAFGIIISATIFVHTANKVYDKMMKNNKKQHVK